MEELGIGCGILVESIFEGVDTGEWCTMGETGACVGVSYIVGGGGNIVPLIAGIP